MSKAREAGANEREITEAIGIAKMVRKAASSRIDNFALSLSRGVPSSSTASGKGCGCKL